MTVTTSRAGSSSPPLRLALGALGVVFGDIGTSPLYAFRESFIGAHPLSIDALGRQTLVPAKRPGMSPWCEVLFAAMVRLSSSAMEYYHLPPGRVIELGRQVEI